MGNFFELVARKTLSGKVPPISERSDVMNTEVDFQVEVKASDNNHHFRISSPQREFHSAKVPFLLDTFLYMLFAYRTSLRRDSEKRTSRMHEAFQGHEQFTVMKEWIHDVFLLDIEVINAFERLLGAEFGKHAGDGAQYPMLELKRTRHLRPLWNGKQHELLTRLKLNPCDWRFGQFQIRKTVTIERRRYMVNFPLFTMLRPGFHADLVRAGCLPDTSSVAV